MSDPQPSSDSHSTETGQIVTVAGFYRFARIDQPDAAAAAATRVADPAGVRGTILFAEEGVNGTIAGSAEGVEAVLAHLRTHPGCGDLTARISHAATQPFRRLKIRVRPEIVTLGLGPIDAAGGQGTYVDPADWNALISDPDTAVIDVRNAYEIRIGSFSDAIDPGTASFRAFPEWWADTAPSLAGRKVAMFCTGGIRCEKATALARASGAGDVFHLKGGILAYLEQVPEAESLWHGGCFVFDERVSVGHGLTPGEHLLCHGCRRPVTPDETESPLYEPGVSCPQCHHEHSAEDRARFRERQRQIDLAKGREET